MQPSWQQWYPPTPHPPSPAEQGITLLSFEQKAENTIMPTPPSSWARHHSFKLNVCSFKYSPQPNAALLLGIKYIVVGEKKTPGLVDQPIVFVFSWSSIKVAAEHIFKTSLRRRCPLLLCRVWMKCSYNKESFFRPISFSTQTSENTKSVKKEEQKDWAWSFLKQKNICVP